MPNLTKSAVSHHAAKYPLEADFSGFVEGFTVIDHAGFRLRQSLLAPKKRSSRAAAGHLARETAARSREEIVFTSGGNGRNNLAITGAVRQARSRHLITSAIEHSSVLTPTRRLAGEGFEVTELPVDAEGHVKPEQVAAALRPDTALASIMAVNNEIETIQPIEEIGRIIRAHNTKGRAHGLPRGRDPGVGQAPPEAGVGRWGLHVDFRPQGPRPKDIGALYVRKRAASCADAWRPAIRSATSAPGPRDVWDCRARHVISLGRIQYSQRS